LTSKLLFTRSNAFESGAFLNLNYPWESFKLLAI